MRRPSHRRDRQLLRHTRTRRLLRYATCSLGSVLLTEGLLYLLYGDLRIASPATCNALASAVAAVPAYALYRRWVWQMQGRSRLWQELVPFFVTVAMGIALSTTCVAALAALLRHSDVHGHLYRAAAIDGGSLAAYALLWVARYFVLDRLIFRRSRRRHTLGAAAAMA